MDVTTETGLFACYNHSPVDVVDPWIAPACAKNIACLRFALSQPCNHIVAERHFPCSPALGHDKPHDLSVKVNVFPFQHRRFTRPRPSHKREIGHRAESRLDVLEESGYLAGSKIVNHAVPRLRHQLDASQRIAGYPLLSDCAVQHAPQSPDLDMNRSLGNRLAGTPSIYVSPSMVYVLADVVRPKLVNVLHRQFGQDVREGLVSSYRMILCAVCQKPLNIFIGKFCEERTSSITVLSTSIEVSLHPLLDLATLLLAPRLRRNTYLLPAMPESRVPSDISVGCLSFPRHAHIQQ